MGGCMGRPLPFWSGWRKHQCHKLGLSPVLQSLGGHLEKMLTYGSLSGDESAAPPLVYGAAGMPGTILQGLLMEHCATFALGSNQASRSPCLMIC